MNQGFYFILFQMVLLLELHSYIEDKMEHHIDSEEHWDKIFKTSRDNRVVD